MGNKAHVLVVPYPAQGHVIPLVELSQRLVKQGLRVTFVSTNFSHGRVNDHDEKSTDGGISLHVALIQDGLSSEDRMRPGKLSEWVLKEMPGKVEELIEEINHNDDDDQTVIKCVVADQSLGWAVDVAERKGIKAAAFCPAAAATMVQGFSIPKWIHQGIIDADGTVLKKQTLKLSPQMPAMKTSNFVWASLGNKAMQTNVFNLMINNNASVSKAQWLLCNSTYDLEPAAFSLAPQALPIGPLLFDHRRDDPTTDDSTLKWLDQQRPNSVTYVAFGSFASLDPTQIQELALGLELSNRPFLWVARLGSGIPDGFLKRVEGRGRVVSWVPQQRVLRHASVACFVSHCGWNSTVEGVSNGLTFLCWPFFADQFVNQSYLCDVWRVGLGLEKDKDSSSSSSSSGLVVVRRDEIRDKLDRVLGDHEMRERALGLKEMVLNSLEDSGQSTNNFKAFVDWIKSSN